MTDDVLKVLAKRAVDQNLMPNRQPDRSWGGLGDGAACHICRSAIDKDQLELEIEFVDESAVRTFRVHVQCYTAWNLQRVQAERSKQRTADAPNDGNACAPIASASRSRLHRQGAVIESSNLPISSAPFTMETHERQGRAGAEPVTIDLDGGSDSSAGDARGRPL